MKKIKVLVNGKPYEVVLNDALGGEMEVTVNGQSYQVSVEDGQVAAATPTASTQPAAPVPAAPAAALRPAVKPVQTTASSGNAMTAPMPGVILDIAVKVGDKVTAGQQLCALEAMKMKNAIRSPREGVIASVAVADGQRVNYGDMLFQFE
jgi:glutaconyl-CoA/methylmalonyl-CoA decarboxylase subunit gamma